MWGQGLLREENVLAGALGKAIELCRWARSRPRSGHRTVPRSVCVSGSESWAEGQGRGRRGRTWGVPPPAVAGKTPQDEVEAREPERQDWF